MMHKTGIKSGSAETVTGALSVTGPQPAWMTLDQARDRAFTGEIVFEVDPEVFAYLDNGVVYYAERASGTPLGRRLLEAGVVDTGQLERGTVRVGDVEHLGRLFDRDASVDRDAVLVVTETATQALIAELANQAVTTVRVTAYRHHPSGVHRWFVAQLDTVEKTGPMASVTQIDAGVVDDLAVPDLGADELTIEWDEFDDGPTDVATLPEVDEFELTMSEGAAPEADDERTDSIILVGEPGEETVDDATADVVPVDDDLGDYHFGVTWPDGTEEPMAAPTDVADSPEGIDAPAFVETDDGELHFEIPPLEMTDDDFAAADDVPDDVAAAVRRAIAAIESAAAAPILPTVDMPAAEVTAAEEPVESESFEMPMPASGPGDVDVDPVDVPAAAEPTPLFAAVEHEPAPRGFGGFAPPTMDTRAEVIYAQMEQEWMAESTFDAAPDAVGDQPNSASMLPSHGVASVVFLDEEPEPEPANERSSALRRLIGSLRRKDH